MKMMSIWRSYAQATVLVFAVSFAAAGAVRADQNSPRLDGLFAELQTILDSSRAAEVEREIWQIWGLPDNRLASIPFAQGIIRMNQHDLEGAREKFDEVIKVAPDFAEGWNKRATVAFYLDDLDASVRDIRETVALEPRHFGALSGLAMIQERLGNVEAALDVLIQVKELYPGMPGLDARMQALRDAIEAKKT